MLVSSCSCRFVLLTYNAAYQAPIGYRPEIFHFIQAFGFESGKDVCPNINFFHLERVSNLLKTDLLIFFIKTIDSTKFNFCFSILFIIVCNLLMKLEKCKNLRLQIYLEILVKFQNCIINKPCSVIMFKIMY